MLDVVIVACMIAKPDVCDTVRLSEAYENTQFIGCAAKAQEMIVEYMIGHSLFRVKRFGCVQHDSKES